MSGGEQQLNSAQEQAVRAPGNCLITACPGSGKTTVLTRRAEFLLKKYPKAGLLGVTFTSEAAKELHGRIVKLVPASKDSVICGTFHALCKKQLEKSGVRVKLVNEFMQTEILRQAYHDVATPGDGLTMEAAKAFIDSTKAAVRPMMPHRFDPRVLVYEGYQERLRQLGAYDFSDLLVLATRGMQDGKIKPFDVKYILADEYQDTDQVQATWLREHLRHGIEVCVVGDDDQAIYGWRFAQGYKALEDFRRDAQATHIALNVTYRCASSIMESSARLIMHNNERIPKSLMTNVPRRGDVQLIRKGSREEEFRAVVAAIQLSGNPGSWGILARTNILLSDFETSSGIKVNRIGGVSIWDLKAPALFMAICRSLTSGEMDGIAQVMRGVGMNDAQVEDMLKRYRSDSPGSLNRFIAENDPPGASSPLALLRERVRSWMKNLSHGSKEVNLVLHGIVNFLCNSVKIYEGKRDEEKLRLDMQRLDSCAGTLKKLHGTLNQRIMYLQSSENDAESKKDLPKVMTLHASKGLEFQNVWILACEEGCIPSPQSPVDEERRLMYVGMTRAKQSLTLSFARDVNPVSRFVTEAGIG